LSDSSLRGAHLAPRGPSGAHRCVDSIEAGTAEVPERFLATEASSVAPRGLSRLGNRPFKRLFPDELAAFGGLAFDGKRAVTSPVALVRRLDEMTCVGCHQSRAVAGFHLLGEERTSATNNALVLGVSEHLRQLLSWRYRFVSDAAEGRTSPEPLPLAERPSGVGDYGAPCSLPESALAGWSCSAGYLCDRSTITDGDAMGVCMPFGERHVGDACEPAAIRTTLSPDGDRIKVDATETCVRSDDASAATVHGECYHARHGFAGGMCTADCTQRGARTPFGVCTRIPHKGFELQCFKDGVILEDCLEEVGNGTTNLLRACSRTTACRDDYACARAPGLHPDEGVCAPTYFVFQARVDGPSVDRRVAESTDIRWPF
jgi:hypothetical protein